MASARRHGFGEAAADAGHLLQTPEAPRHVAHAIRPRVPLLRQPCPRADRRCRGRNREEPWAKAAGDDTVQLEPVRVITRAEQEGEEAARISDIVFASTGPPPKNSIP